MIYNPEEIVEKIRRYYYLKESISKYPLDELKKLPKDYRDFLEISHDLSHLVLTGDELLDIFPLEKFAQEENLEEMSSKINDIWTLIGGKQGDFFDKIREILLKKY